MAIGAYGAAAFTKYAGPRLVFPPGITFGCSLLLAALLAGLAGLIVGLPSLRLRGDYLAIVTLGFGQIIIAIIVTVDELGGALGLSDVPVYTNFVWLFSPRHFVRVVRTEPGQLELRALNARRARG